jgi:hypothetical protein
MFPPVDWAPQRPSAETPGGRFRNWRGTREEDSSMGLAEIRGMARRRRVGILKSILRSVKIKMGCWRIIEVYRNDSKSNECVNLEEK